MKGKSKADICLILEGTYPYISGGVSSWTHDLLRAQPDRTFNLLCLMPPKAKLDHKYQVPSNVLDIVNVFLQELTLGPSHLPRGKAPLLLKQLEMPLLQMQHRPTLKLFSKILEIFHSCPTAGRRILLDSREAWNMVVRMYSSTVGQGSFLNYFWTWRGILGAFYSILLAPIPEADLYHTVCTGYAGLFTARAHLETKKPCVITEHGIYTNERRIEITSAKWIEDRYGHRWNLDRRSYERDLKNVWVDSFNSYSQVCYDACEEILTLYEGNQELQIADGADPKKLAIIPNGIDYDRYEGIQREKRDYKAVALLGRCVPIKDVKTYIRSCALLFERVPNVRGYVLGPTDEDEEYFEECRDLVKQLGVEDKLTFEGKIDIVDWFSKFDVMVLTSISEAMPLTVLEAGASGIPSVTTHVGSCKELIYGRSDEDPPLGKGGEVVFLADPEATATALARLLTDEEFYTSCSEAIKKRVYTYYRSEQQDEAYKELYDRILRKDRQEQVSEVGV